MAGLPKEEFLKYENEAYAEGRAAVAGTDEAGRGPLCGPVAAAAVILPRGWIPDGLDDSKKLSEKKRESLFGVIEENAVSFAVAFASVEEIDELNILNASQLAMRRAVEALSPAPDFVIIDGNVSRGFKCETRTVVHGDALSASVAAASVLAKVSRDRLMRRLSEEYPEYELWRHKGYPTARHIELLKKYGYKKIYRKTFVKKFVEIPL